MATRKTKRYNEGGDVLDRMMGSSSSDEGGRNEDAYRVDPLEGPGRDANGFESMMGSMEKFPTFGDDAKPMPKPTRENSIMEDMITAKPFSGNQSGPANLASMMGQAQNAGGLEGMIGALKGARSSIPERGRDMGNRMGGMAKGGKVSSASSRGDGIAQRGKTRGKMC